jgi:hypothetical protein
MAHPSLSGAQCEAGGATVEIIASPAKVDGERHSASHTPDLGEHDAALRAEFGA